MRYLFIDTSGKDMTIAIANEDRVLSTTTSNKENEHSKYALVELKKSFALAGIKPEDINKIIVVNGPGSFTGVRIGVTVAKTYAWALNKDIMPISSLLTYALGYAENDYYVSILDARRESVYAAIYDHNYNEVLKEQYISIAKLKDIIVQLKGDILITGNVAIEGYITSPIKINVISIIKHLKDTKPSVAHLLKPNYLKQVEAEEKLMGMKE